MHLPFSVAEYTNLRIQPLLVTRTLPRVKGQPGLVDHQLQNALLSALGRASLWQAALLEILVGQGRWC